MEWIKKNRSLCLCLLIIICCGIPIGFNLVLSFDIIPSNNTNSADWLGFWGSFLGGVIGGIATLLGVLLSISQINKDKEHEEEKKKPIIVPLKKNIYIYVCDYYENSEREVGVSCYNNKVKNGDYYGEEIYIDLINIGIEHALNINYEFILPDYQEVDKYFDNNNILKDKKNEFLEAFNKIKDYPSNVCNALKDKSNIQIIKSSEVLEKHVVLEFKQEMLICNLMKIMNKDKPYSFLCKNMPLGSIIFKYTDTLGKDQKNVKYKMYLSFSGSEGAGGNDIIDSVSMNDSIISFINEEKTIE